MGRAHLRPGVSSMKAVQQNEYGGVDKLHYVTDAAEPQPADDEVLVSLAATSVNPVDWKQRTGEAKAMFPLTFPAILGRDISGIVRAIGSRVTGVAVGDRVMSVGRSTYAELAVVPAVDITHLPANLEITDAAALPLVVGTGDQLVREGCALQAGQTVLITGALGSVGRCAVYSARSLGAKVIAGVRRADLEEAKALQVDAVLALDDQEQLSRLGQVDAVADTVGGETAAQLLTRVLPGGIFATVVALPSGAELTPRVQTKRVTSHPDANRLRAMAQEFADGKFALPIGRRLPLEQAAEAQTLAAKGGIGKVLLLML